MTKRPEDMTHEELIEELVWRREQMAPEPPVSELDTIRSAMGLTPQEGRIVLALVAAKDRGVSVRQIIEIARVTGAAERVRVKTTDVHISRIRAKAGRGMIETVSKRIALARRYVATAPLREAVATALGQTPEQQRSA